jgi:hypothetical protein
MGAYRSSKTHELKHALASRTIWRATGMTDADQGTCRTRHVGRRRAQL